MNHDGITRIKITQNVFSAATRSAAERFIDTERDLLLRDGISTFTTTDDGVVVLERVITHYQRTNLNIEDTAWLDVMTSKTLSRIRYDWGAYMGQTWPRAKLADDGAPAAEYDPEIATPRRLHGSWAARCALYERLGWIQQASESAAESVFVRDVNDRNRVNARLYIRILGNLMTLAGVLEFSQ
jgi:phage tail sheath gpL-like